MLRINYFWWLILVITVTNAVTGVFFVTNPSGGLVRTFIAAEDALLENLTVAFFFFAFIFGLALLFTRQVNEPLNRKGLYLISAVGLIGFLDELSWGERLFDLKVPNVYGVDIDAFIPR